MVAAVVLREVSGVVPPTAFMNLVVPEPPVMVRALAPFRVDWNVMKAFVELIVLVPVMLTGLGNVRGLAPVTVIFAPMSIRLALVKTRLVRGVGDPTAPLNATTPVPATKVKELFPVMDPLKVIVPFAVVRTGEVVSVTVFVKVIGSAVVVIPAPRLTPPPPD